MQLKVLKRVKWHFDMGRTYTKNFPALYVGLGLWLGCNFGSQRWPAVPYLHLSLNHTCLCVCSPPCPWCSVWRCLSISLAVCNLEPVCSCCIFFFPPLILPLAPLKWQFVKHGPLLALSFASQPFPARLLPSLICPPSPLLLTSLVLHPSLTFPPLSFPYLLCALHPRLSPPLRLFMSPCRSVSLPHLPFRAHVISIL